MLNLPEDAVEFKIPKFKTFQIRGKVRDFHYHDFSKPILPIMIEPLSDNDPANTVLIKVSSANPFGTIKEIERLFNETLGGNLFDGDFLDGRIAAKYQNQNRLSKLLTGLSFLAIIISSLGMIAMGAYFITQRSQEVAVRKIFGARQKKILTMLLNGFLILVLIAFVISVPIILYLMRQWLNGYIYRIPLNWTIFVTAGLVIFTIALLTVLWQSLKATMTNPVITLKDS